MMSRHTGKLVEPAEHIRQSIEDILTTPKGSRVMLRTYGSRIFELLGRPIDKMSLYVAVHEAIAEWEPRVRLDGVRMLDSPEDRAKIRDGIVSIELDGVITLTGRPFNWRMRLT